MNEKKLEKRLRETLNQEALDLGAFPFIFDLDKRTDSPLPYLMSEVEHKQNTPLQIDFLTHKILTIKE